MEEVGAHLDSQVGWMMGTVKFFHFAEKKKKLAANINYTEVAISQSGTHRKPAFRNQKVPVDFVLSSQKELFDLTFSSLHRDFSLYTS